MDLPHGEGVIKSASAKSRSAVAVASDGTFATAASRIQRNGTDGTASPEASVVRSVRIELARRLLARSSLSCEEVSQQCGYTSAVTFRRAFMTETGISPRECRMRLVKKGQVRQDKLG